MGLSGVVRFSSVSDAAGADASSPKSRDGRPELMHRHRNRWICRPWNRGYRRWRSEPVPFRPLPPAEYASTPEASPFAGRGRPGPLPVFEFRTKIVVPFAEGRVGIVRIKRPLSSRSAYTLRCSTPSVFSGTLLRADKQLIALHIGAIDVGIAGNPGDFTGCDGFLIRQDSPEPPGGRQRRSISPEMGASPLCSRS